LLRYCSVLLLNWGKAFFASKFKLGGMYDFQ